MYRIRLCPGMSAYSEKKKKKNTMNSESPLVGYINAEMIYLFNYYYFFIQV